ncbi:MAG: class I SAM-dependent methyltransferase, partial [Vicinamibacterales bacterium]
VGLAADRVAPGGLFALAVYNRCATAFAWKIVKRVYNRVPAFMQGCAATVLFLVRALARVVRGRHPLRDRRGMTVYVDAYDWLGGYPYEYATITEMEQMIAPLGFELLRVKPTRGSGCNEFVFRRRGD